MKLELKIKIVSDESLAESLFNAMETLLRKNLDLLDDGDGDYISYNHDNCHIHGLDNYTEISFNVTK